jgi:hypothetical protein
VGSAAEQANGAQRRTSSFPSNWIVPEFADHPKLFLPAFRSPASVPM